MNMKILPLFAGLSIESQMRIFEPTSSDVRKVIISTNVSETSVTINDVVYVVDCGFVKVFFFFQFYRRTSFLACFQD
jgi:ATP-dependent RNA helicase DDX35